MRSVRLGAVVFNKLLLSDVLILVAWGGLGMCCTGCTRDWKRMRHPGAHPSPLSRAKAQAPDSCALLCRDRYSGSLSIGAFRQVGEIPWKFMFRNCYDTDESALGDV